MKVPLCITKLQSKELKIINKSLKTGWLTHGKSNHDFEKKFSSYIGCKYSISMNSCTSALECSVKTLKKKGEIIIPSFTWVSTANAIINSGCKPVFADVDINSRNITAENIENKITKKTVAVIVVHYGGLPCEMDKILKLCKNKKIQVIEDSAETIGAKFKNKYTGSFGVGCFSFFPTKNITTTEGGMFTTNNKKQYNYVKKLIAHGIKKNPKKPWLREAIIPGHNFRMPNHLAALGIIQLNQIKKFNSTRNKIAKKYNNFFSKYSNLFKVQKVLKNFTHSYQMYTILVNTKYRNSFLKYLIKFGIGASIHFVPPLHQQKYLQKYNKYKLINTEILSKKIITLPMSHYMTMKQANYVIKISKKWINKL